LSVPARTNRYLFRDLGAPPALVLTTARVSWVVFAASLLVLAAGLAVIYLPIMRSARVSVVATLCLLPLAVAYPTTAVLVAQAAVVGVILTLLAYFLRLLFKPDVETVMPSGMDSIISDEPRSSTRSYITDPQPDSYLSAATTIAIHSSDAGE